MGLTYVSGRQCRLGHTERYANGNHCVVCKIEAAKVRRATKPESNEHRRTRYDRKLAEDPIWNAAKARRRRDLIAKLEGSHTQAEIDSLYVIQFGKCAYFDVCGHILGDKYERDHIVPVTRGGSNWIRNMQLLCVPCSRSKHNRDPIDHARKIGLLI